MKAVWKSKLLQDVWDDINMQIKLAKIWEKAVSIADLSTLPFSAGASRFGGASPDLPFSRHFLPF